MNQLILLILAFLSLTNCQKKSGASDLYKFDDYQIVEVLVNIDYKLTQTGGPKIDIEEQKFHLNAFILDESSTQVAIARSDEGVPVMDLPVSIQDVSVEFDAFVAVPVGVALGSEGYAIHFVLSEIEDDNISLDGTTIESIKNLDAIVGGIQPGKKNPVHMSLATSIAYILAKESGALDDLELASQTYSAISDLVKEQTVAVVESMQAGKTVSFDMFVNAVVASVKLQFATDQNLQQKVASLVEENSTEPIENFAENFTGVLKSFAEDANTVFGEEKNTDAAMVFKTETLAGMTIPDPETYSGVIYVVSDLAFSDQDETGAIGGTLKITAPIMQTGIVTYEVYFGADSASKSKIEHLGSVNRDEKKLELKFADGTQIPADASHFWVFARTKNGELSVGASVVINNVHKPSGLSYLLANATYTAGSIISDNTASSTGGKITNYSISPNLPAGLNFNTTTGRITGRPTTTQGMTNYVVTGTNSSGSTTTAISISITAAAPASVELSSPAVVGSGQNFSLSGSCSGELGTITIDIGNDGSPTAGVSLDPLTCTCENSSFNCPAISIDYPLFAAQKVSFKSSISSSWAGTDTETLVAATDVVYMLLQGLPKVAVGQTLDPAGLCSPNGASVTVTAPPGFTPASRTCACTNGNLIPCDDFTEATAVWETPLTLSASITQGTKSMSSSKTIAVGNVPPVALSGASGEGFAFQASQRGGLSWTRYGHNNPAGNRIMHDDLMDFVDDPIGHMDGLRADGFTPALQNYPHDMEGVAGWDVSVGESNDKYANAGKITPVAGNDYFGDTYRGYFVPPQDGVYKFIVTSVDNSVRLMMAPNECPKDAIAVVSADWAANAGAVNPASLWINGNDGVYVNTKNYNHNVAAFYPDGEDDTDYEHGATYLRANKIYYMEIRYGEGGGQNAFSFNLNRRDFGSAVWDGATDLLANDVLPYSGDDQYVPREACGGSTYDASLLFTDYESDVLEFSAKLVNADGSEISGAAANISHIGLNLDTNTGFLTGSVNGNYTNQKIVFSARDPLGSNLWADADPIDLVQ